MFVNFVFVIICLEASRVRHQAMLPHSAEVELLQLLFKLLALNPLNCNDHLD